MGTTCIRVALATLVSALALGAPAKAGEQVSAPTISIKADSLTDAEAVAARHRVTVERAFAWIDWYELSVPAGTTDARNFAADVSYEPEVRAVDAVAPGERLTPQFQPRDAFWGQFFISPSTNQNVDAQWHLVKANFPSAFDVSTGANVQMGIIDSEFATDHTDLSPKVRNPYSTASGTAEYHTGNVKDNGRQSWHGSHVAGIAAAVTDNGVGGSGAGFDATFVPVKVSTSFEPGSGNPVDGNFVTDLTEALGYMMNQNVAVVNMSLGTTRSHQPLADAIAALKNKGVTIVVSAGNFQQSQPNAPIYPASYPGAIAVANTTIDDAINPSSSNGSWVDIAAPGTEIVAPMDAGAVGVRPTAFAFPQQNPQAYDILSGTSMAAPVVTGLVALMKSKRPDLTPDEVETILKGTAKDLGSAGPDPQFGAGRIDAAAAVNAAAAYVRPTPPAPEPPPAPAPPADTVAPKTSINGLVTLGKTGRKLTVRFRCNEACSGTVRVRLNNKRKSKQKLIGSRSFKSLGSGKTATLTIKLKRRLKSGAKVIIEVAAKDGAGNLATTRQVRKLRR